ncbi:TrmH family RNA methyltransferase [Lentibacillus saliphilus]|uniref:TrmH family RNA methyltransferase n=1 Tax=Lentibacillus saliphilus TaxID=2737028 RepID=UPI001C2F936C|nr:RNA methyltransferase [Lentibacillus saliphilus]
MITSKKNEHIKQWKKLQTKKGREQLQAFWIEGFHLVEEAITSEWPVKHIVIGEHIQVPTVCADYPLTVVSDHVFDYLTTTKQPQRIGAIIEFKEPSQVTGHHILLIDAVQDPGNLGTMIRTADAAGFDGVIVGNGSADVYNDKVIRSTQGSLFHIPVIQADLHDQVNALQADGFAVWAAALEHAHTYTTVQPEEKVALIVGNEGAGISEDLIKQADQIVSIPIRGRAESLNVSIAAAILMYYIKG